MNSKNYTKDLKKRLFRILDRYGVFNERPFIKKEYREALFKDILRLYGEDKQTTN
jgi:hypothetical protein